MTLSNLIKVPSNRWETSLEGGHPPSSSSLSLSLSVCMYVCVSYGTCRNHRTTSDVYPCLPPFRGLDWSLSLIYTSGFVPLIATILTTSPPSLERRREFGKDKVNTFLHSKDLWILKW